MARKNGTTTAVTVANAADEAKSLARAAEHYRARIGEPNVGPEFVAALEEAFQQAESAVLQDAARVGSLLLGPGGEVEVEDAVGKGRRSRASGPRSPKDATYRLVALIMGNPTCSDDKDKVYAGLRAYDAKGLEEKRTPRVKISEGTAGTFASMRLWSESEWESLEARLEARMAGREVAAVADEECSGCRRSKAYAESRGLVARPCRPCATEAATPEPEARSMDQITALLGAVLVP